MKRVTLYLILFSSLLFSSQSVMAQNCTDYHLCFEKRLDTNGDTIVDVIMIDPPDSVGLFRTTVVMSAEAFDVNTFGIDSVFLEDSPTYSEGGTTDELATGDFYLSDPRSTTLDTVKLYSFSLDGPPGDCIDLSFGLISSGVYQNGVLTTCRPDTNALKSCATSICIPSVEISGVVEALVDCQDSVANDFGMRDVIVSVYQDSSSSLYDSDRTTSQGDYSVLVAPGHDYVVTPTIDTSRYIDTCGVTEVDMVVIREHILGTDPFDYPYECIAADANQDGAISLGDEIVIGKAITGDSTAYLGWEFIPTEEYLSLDNTTMTPPEILSASNSDTLLNLNFSPSVPFTGIKIGDVNLTCTDCYSSRGGSGSGSERLLAEPSDTEQFKLQFPANVNLGDLIEVPLYASDFTGEGVMGLHLWANPSYLTFEGATPVYLPDPQYFFHSEGESGQLSIVWFNVTEGGASVGSNEPLAYLKIKVHTLPADWSDIIALQNPPGRNMVYPDGSIIGHPISLEVFAQDEVHPEEGGISLSVLENPFRNELRFSATAAREVTVTIDVLNQNGERMIQATRRLYPGKNDMLLTNVANLPTGAYLLRLTSMDGNTSTKKIIKQ
ncbi:MAG: T9SS type A sorting domain-containing protein [Bacteroidetes bacterium]|jgi:hypothetical protein|nr:T9SS type A sorting domain-containing protein [Bacteroidota bacterium]